LHFLTTSLIVAIGITVIQSLRAALPNGKCKLRLRPPNPQSREF